MIDIVTITGPDDTTDINDLIRLQEKYPFVEWGILLGSRCGPRFPSMGWLKKLQTVASPLKLSAHLCGRHVRAALIGHEVYIDDESDCNFYSNLIKNKCDRIQLNTHGEYHEYNDRLWELCKHWQVTPIIQVDNVNNSLKEDGLKNNADLIFDISHGAGILCEAYPEIIDNAKCTYAGGLGPINLKEEILKMLNVAKDKPFNIDMETKVRTYDPKFSSNINYDYFDIVKVEQCLEIAKEFVC